MARTKKQKMMAIAKKRAKNNLMKKRRAKEYKKLKNVLKKKHIGEIMGYNLSKVGGMFTRILKSLGYNLPFLKQRKREMAHRVRRHMKKTAVKIQNAKQENAKEETKK